MLVYKLHQKHSCLKIFYWQLVFVFRILLGAKKKIFITCNVWARRGQHIAVGHTLSLPTSPPAHVQEFSRATARWHHQCRRQCVSRSVLDLSITVHTSIVLGNASYNHWYEDSQCIRCSIWQIIVPRQQFLAQHELKNETGMNRHFPKWSSSKNNGDFEARTGFLFTNQPDCINTCEGHCSEHAHAVGIGPHVRLRLCGCE